MLSLSATLANQILQALRQRGGVATSAELQAALGVSQPTVSRALAPLLRAGQVQKVGAARTQRYVLPRHLAGVGCNVPIMRVDASREKGSGLSLSDCQKLPEGHDLQRRIS